MRIGVSPALSCPPRARLVVAAPSSPCCRARVIDADVVIASTWPQSSPCPRRRRAVVPAPSSPRRRLRVAAASSPRHRPRTVVSVPLLNPHPYPHLYPHPMSSPVVVRPRLYTLTSLRHPHPVLAIAASSSPRRLLGACFSCQLPAWPRSCFSASRVLLRLGLLLGPDPTYGCYSDRGHEGPGHGRLH